MHCEVIHLPVSPQVFRKPPQIMKYLILSDGFLLETGKGNEIAVDLKTPRDSEATEAGGNELSIGQML